MFANRMTAKLQSLVRDYQTGFLASRNLLEVSSLLKKSSIRKRRLKPVSPQVGFHLGL